MRLIYRAKKPLGERAPRAGRSSKVINHNVKHNEEGVHIDHEIAPYLER
jgi:hypothetical protein